ncbi:MAG: adenylate kinase [Acidimicrobiales bacterium]
MNLRAILLGPPGSGKGTQAAFIVERFKITHISSGDLFRRHVRERSPIGLHLEPYLSAGDLVPDDLVFEMLAESIALACASGGYLLDGFPRTLAQAEKAYELAESAGFMLHAVVALQAPPEVLVERLLRRGEESGRPDDTEAVIRHRLSVHEQNTAPLLDYYERRGILQVFDASPPVEEVRERLLGRLDEIVAPADED